MSKFIKVTVIEQNGSTTEHRINSSSIESFKDGEVRLRHGFESYGFVLNVEETAEQIEAQLLRDEFAIRILNGFLSGAGKHHEDDTRFAYTVADAMLKERSK